MAAYGESGVRVGHERRPRDEWLALKPGAHEGYVDWDRAEAIRTMVSNNRPASKHHGAAKHGDALLAGLVRCRRCGRKLTVRYSGRRHDIPRYACRRDWLDNGGPSCISFGGLRVDDAVEAAARYAVDRAFRQYDAADPANRLVASELEARWEAALERQREVEAKLSAHDGASLSRPDPSPVPFATLARDLQAVWNAPATDARLGVNHERD